MIEIRKFYQPVWIEELDCTLTKREQFLFPQFPQFAVEVDRRKANRVRQIVLRQGTGILAYFRGPFSCDATTKLQNDVRYPPQNTAATEVDHVFAHNGEPATG